MIRTQISISPEQMAAARIEAERRNVSLAALIREALARLLDEDAATRARERARDAVGGFRSGTSTTSERHDEALAESPRW